MEEAMNDKLFDSPIYVKDGNLVVQQIDCLSDALDLLQQWPLARRDTMFEMMQAALHGAYDNRVPVPAARSAFLHWSRSTGILEDVSLAQVWNTGARVGDRDAPS